ncbi:MAG: GerAB/ArcD/ProY family transporter [Bacillota bacterium]
MIESTDRKIGTRELTALLIISISYKIADMTPITLFKEGQNAAWMMPVISALIMLIPFFALLSLLKKYENKGLIDLIYLLAGKYIGFIISIAIFAVTFAETVLNSRNFVDIQNALFYSNTPTIAIYILVTAGCFFVASRGFEVIAGISRIFIPVIGLVIILLIILAWKDANFSYLFPIAGPGPLELLKGSFKNSFILWELFIFTTFFSFSRNYKSFKKASLLGLVVGIFVISLFIIIYTGIYDYPGVEELAFPFQKLKFYVNIGRFFRNIEAFFLFFWIIGFVIRFSAYLYLSTAIFAHSLRLKEFEPLLLPMAGLTILLGMIPPNSIKAILVLRENIVFNGSFILFFFLPPILWGISKLKGDYKR